MSTVRMSRIANYIIYYKVILFEKQSKEKILIFRVPWCQKNASYVQILPCLRGSGSFFGFLVGKSESQEILLIIILNSLNYMAFIMSSSR